VKRLELVSIGLHSLVPTHAPSLLLLTPFGLRDFTDILIYNIFFIPLAWYPGATRPQGHLPGSIVRCVFLVASVYEVYFKNACCRRTSKLSSCTRLRHKSLGFTSQPLSSPQTSALILRGPILLALRPAPEVGEFYKGNSFH